MQNPQDAEAGQRVSGRMGNDAAHVSGLLRSEGLTAEFSAAPEADEELAEEWQALADDVPQSLYSVQPATIRIWAETIRPDGRVRIIAFRDTSGKLRGIIPVMFDRVWRGPSFAARHDYDPRDRDYVVQGPWAIFPLRQVTLASSMPAMIGWIGPLCRDEDRPAVIGALARSLVELGGWDVAVIQGYLSDSDLWKAAFRTAGTAAAIQNLGREIKDLRKVRPLDEILASRKWKFRQNVGRARAAAEAAGLAVSFHEGRAEVLPRLDTFADLAQASWKQIGRKGEQVVVGYEGTQRTFVERLLRDEEFKCEPVLGLISDAEGAVAALLILRRGNRADAVLTFWNGRHRDASPGLVLIGASIDWAHAAGIRHYFYNATSPWVRHLSDTTNEVVNVVAFAPRPYGRLLARVRDALDRVRSRGRTEDGNPK